MIVFFTIGNSHPSPRYRILGASTGENISASPQLPDGRIHRRHARCLRAPVRCTGRTGLDRRNRRKRDASSGVAAKNPIQAFRGCIRSDPKPHSLLHLGPYSGGHLPRLLRQLESTQPLGFHCPRWIVPGPGHRHFLWPRPRGGSMFNPSPHVVRCRNRVATGFPSEGAD